MKYIKDQGLIDILNNKRITIVAPSQHLTGRGLGKIIDQYDIICRVGEFYPYGAEIDYGSRTDIFIGAFNDQTPSLMKKEFEIAKKLNVNLDQIKYVICPQFSRDVHTNNNILNNFYNTKELSNIPFHHIGDEYFLQLKNDIGTPPNTGLIAIPVLLNYNLKELFMIGYSFYQDSKLSDLCYRKGYAGYGNPNAGGGHKHEAQIAYFKILLRTHSKIIKIDSYLNELLKLGYENVFQL